MSPEQAGARPPFVLGIDAGGTKTIGLLADANGTVLGESRMGGANLQALGELEVEKVLHAVMDEAIGGRALVPAAICLGIAGVDRAEDAAVVRAIMRRIGFKARVIVTNDALVALVAGVGHEPGVVIISGTGSIAYGRNRTNEAARAGGWGYILGDEGSGYWIGRHALRAVVREADGRSVPTSLTPRILAHFRIDRPDQLVHEVYHGSSLRPSAIASLAGAVEEAAADGDTTARAILDQAAQELVTCAASVTNRLHLTHESFWFVLAGGIFRAVPSLAAAMRTRLPGIAPSARIKLLDQDPAMGAVQIALAEARGEDAVPAYRSR